MREEARVAPGNSATQRGRDAVEIHGASLCETRGLAHAVEANDAPEQGQQPSPVRTETQWGLRAPAILALHGETNSP